MYKKVIIIQYFFIYILFSPFNIIESKIIINENKVYNIKYNLYEIKLKLKGTGIINILSSSSSYNYTCPSNIDLIKGPYLNVTDCHQIAINGSETEIKLIWDGIVINILSFYFEEYQTYIFRC